MSRASSVRYDASSDKFISLTRDHSLDNPQEVQRLHNVDAPIKGKRCFGLQPTRTVGDVDIKKKQRSAILSLAETSSLILQVIKSGSWESARS